MKWNLGWSNFNVRVKPDGKQEGWKVRYVEMGKADIYTLSILQTDPILLFFFLFFFSLVFPLFFFSFHFCLFFLLSSTYSSATLLQSTLLRNSCSHYTTDATSFYLSSSLDHSLYFHYDACHRLWLYHHLKSLMLIKGQTILILSQCVYAFVCSCVQSYLNYFLFYLFIYYYLLWFNFIFVCFFFPHCGFKTQPTHGIFSVSLPYLDIIGILKANCVATLWWHQIYLSIHFAFIFLYFFVPNCLSLYFLNFLFFHL